MGIKPGKNKHNPVRAQDLFQVEFTSACLGCTHVSRKNSSYSIAAAKVFCSPVRMDLNRIAGRVASRRVSPLCVFAAAVSHCQVCRCRSNVGALVACHALRHFCSSRDGGGLGQSSVSGCWCRVAGVQGVGLGI